MWVMDWDGERDQMKRPAETCGVVQVKDDVHLE